MRKDMQELVKNSIYIGSVIILCIVVMLLVLWIAFTGWVV